MLAGEPVAGWNLAGPFPCLDLAPVIPRSPPIR